MATTSKTRSGFWFAQRGVVMKFVMNMVRKLFKAGKVIFDFGAKSDDLYLIHSGSVEIVSSEGLVLAPLKARELFGEMASILGERERATRAVTATNTNYNSDAEMCAGVSALGLVTNHLSAELATVSRLGLKAAF